MPEAFAPAVFPRPENFLFDFRMETVASIVGFMEDWMSDSNSSRENASPPLDFSALYDRYATDVLRVSYYYLGDRQKAEDITQDVFVKLLTVKPALVEGKEKAWLLKVALNKCRDTWRNSWYKRVILGHPAFELFPAPDEIGSLAEEQALTEAIGRLPSEFKEVVLLYYYQGFSVAEIAEMYNMAEGTVSSRLSRARSKLKGMLDDHE
jgi:RNA polymerase sigma-70 factor (ECF subfamily)